jgi:hypothetical protein
MSQRVEEEMRDVRGYWSTSSYCMSFIHGEMKQKHWEPLVSYTIQALLTLISE